jgi:hypothetical protein
MRINPKKEDLSTRSTGSFKGYTHQEDFDLDLESFDDFDFSLDEPKKSAFIANESSVKVLPVEAPQHIIRRAIRDLESGSLDELLVHRLIGLDRESAEFRQEYINLRVESLMRPRSSFSPCTELAANSNSDRETSTFTSKAKPRIVPREVNYKSPWAVNTLGDLWSFFGPWLTFIVALELYSSYQLGSMFESQEILHGNFPINIGTLIIAFVSLATSVLFLMRSKGQDYKNFIPRLAGIGIVSALISIASHLLLIYR